MIGILTAISLPNFLAAQGRAKESSVKGNMHTAQVAAESYATIYGGVYPGSVDIVYESFFPGGGNDGVTAGNALTNPFTQTTGFPNQAATCTQASDIASVRQSSPPSVSTSGSGVEFDPIPSPGGYAILGAGANGKGIANAAGSTLLLSNM
jgi:type II secretory pathway pseudopilin PulG